MRSVYPMTNQFIRFLVPLSITMLVYSFGTQVINSGLARAPRPVESLAAFAVAWGIVELFVAFISPSRQVCLVLAESGRSLRRIHNFIIVLGLLAAGFIGTLAFTPVGTWILEGAHDTDPDLSAIIRSALALMMPLPLLESLMRAWAGVMIRLRRTEIVSAASLAGIGAMIAVVPPLLPTEFVQVQPIRLAIGAIYAGIFTNSTVLLWGYFRYAHGRLERHTIAEGAAARPPACDRDPDRSDVTAITYQQLWHFFWPLSLTITMQGASRPLINLFVSRSPGGEEALAILGIVYVLSFLPYGWLNDLRAVAPAFLPTGRATPEQIRQFAVSCCLLSLALTVLMLWAPLRQVILIDLISLKPSLAERCFAPLLAFSPVAIPVTVRAYFQGMALYRRRTEDLAPSAPGRIGIIVVVLLVIPETAMSGATRGMLALTAGFALEAVIVWWFVGRGDRGG